jgi:hypothetical protein
MKAVRSLLLVAAACTTWPAAQSAGAPAAAPITITLVRWPYT